MWLVGFMKSNLRVETGGNCDHETLHSHCPWVAFPKTHRIHATYDSQSSGTRQRRQTKQRHQYDQGGVVGGCGNGGLIVCINMRELCNSSGESNHYHKPKHKKRSDGIDTVYVGLGSTLCSPSQQHCPGSLFTLLCSLFYYGAPARVEWLWNPKHPSPCKSFIDNFITVTSSVCHGKDAGRHLTFQHEGTSQFAQAFK